MPVLDPYQSQVRLSGVNVQATADDFGGQSARAISQLGGELENTSNVVAQVDDAKSRMRAAAFMTQADLDWRQKMIDMQNDPDFQTKYGVDGSGFADSFRDQFEQYAQEQIQNSDPRDRKYVEQGMYNLGESLMNSSMQYQAEVGAAFASDTLKKSIDNGSISAKLSPDQYTSILANATLMVNTAQNLDATTRRRFSEAATQQITTGAAMGRLEKGGEGAAKAIKNGSMTFLALDENGKPVQKSLRDLVDARTFEVLSDQADTVIKKAESDRKQIFADIKSDIETGIEMAETPEDFLNISNAIKTNEAIFTHQQMNDLKVKMYKKSKSIREDYDSVDRGNAFASGQAYLNPANNDSVKDYNNYYNKKVAPVLADMQPEERNTYLANMVATTKVIPDALKGDIKVAARSTDANLLASTADFVDRLRIQNPHLIQDIDQRDLARIDMMNSKLASGATIDEAAKQVEDALNPANAAVYEKRTSDLKDLEVDYQSLAMKNFNAPWYVKVLPGDSGSVSDTSSNFATRQIAQLTSEYRAAYETQYKLTGSQDAAEKYANQLVSGTYGVTKVNGNNQLMRFSPEKYFSIAGQDNDWMREQVLEEARKQLSNSWVDPKTTAEDNVIIVPVPGVTSRTAKEGRPLYKMMLLTQDGGYQDLLGGNKYFTFDPDKKIKTIVDEAKQEAILEGAQ